jgi:hypothetical protein
MESALGQRPWGADTYNFTIFLNPRRRSVRVRVLTRCEKKLV